MSSRSLASLFGPRSVAIVGASEDPRKWGNWLARGALRGEHRRSAYLVNHRGAEIMGRGSYRALGELPERPELVVVAVPDTALERTVEEALAAGARAIVAISAGNADGAASGVRDRALAAQVREAGAVLLGPNCLGVLDSGEELELIPNALPAGAIGLISQSGNLALELGLLAAEEGLGFSRFVSLGNQADLDATALVREFTEHKPTKLIALYVEDFRDGREFARAAAGAVDSGKPVLALAIPRGDGTSRAVRSHTGALASDGAAIEAACRAAGVERVQTPRELIDVAQALLRCRRTGGQRVAVLSDGGGHGSIAAEVSLAAGLELPELGTGTVGLLRELLPSRAGVSNPVDIAGGAERDVHTFDRVASVLIESGEVDAVLITGYFGGYAEYDEELGAEELRVAGLLGRAASSSGRPIVAHTMYASAPAARALRDAGVPVYADIERAVGALARLTPDAGGRREIPALPEPAADPPPHPEAVTGSDGYELAREILTAGGVPFVAQRTVGNAAEAKLAAAELGYPVALKALGLVHKSDAGGVVLGVPDESELERAYADLERRLAPAACSVEQMATVADGVELLIGARWDPRFGPVALAGSGGVYTEILRDTAVSLAPVSDDEAESMLRSLRASPLLLGARGRPRLALELAAQALAALSRVAASHPELSEIEVNPLLVTPNGVIALDARLVRATVPVVGLAHA
jgi:acetate---CoA ligase (ADP-forming)